MCLVIEAVDCTLSHMKELVWHCFAPHRWVTKAIFAPLSALFDLRVFGAQAEAFLRGSWGDCLCYNFQAVLVNLSDDRGVGLRPLTHDGANARLRSPSCTVCKGISGAVSV